MITKGELHTRWFSRTHYFWPQEPQSSLCVYTIYICMYLRSPPMAGCAREDEASPLVPDEELALGEAIAEVATDPPPSPDGMILADSLVYIAAAALTRRAWTMRQTRQTAWRLLRRGGKQKLRAAAVCSQTSDPSRSLGSIDVPPCLCKFWSKAGQRQKMSPRWSVKCRLEGGKGGDRGHMDFFRLQQSGCRSRLLFRRPFSSAEKNR